MSNCYNNLINRVKESSENVIWREIVLEWDIIDCEEDECAESQCICSKENIRYLYRIKNKLNNNILFPIGSTCIKKFNRADLNEITSIQEGMFKLLHAINNNAFISLDGEFFSRKLIKALYNRGAFTENKYNNWSGFNDYEFLVRMFNKRKDPTQSEKSKINAIIINSIKPFLRSILN